MPIDAWLKSSVQQLTEAGIDSARLDCLLLLEDATGKDRGWLLAHSEFELSDEQLETLGKQLNRRARHIPLAYIRGRVEFYGRSFAVNKHVLVPRPESEAMIGLLKDLAVNGDASKADKKAGLTIIDVGTGSGALAVTAKLEVPAAAVIGTDIDPACLEVARRNAAALHVDCSFMEADLLSPDVIASAGNNFIILANLPYVPDGYPINRAATHEPKLALFAGIDGLDLYKQLWQQIAGAATKPQAVITEALEDQHHALATIARHYGYLQTAKEGLAQAFTPL